MAIAWLKKLLGAAPSQTPQPGLRRRPSYKPSLDLLEERIVPITAVTNLNTATPQGLVTNILGNNSGMVITNIKYTGDNQAAGIFAGGANSVGMATGIVFSTGLAAQVVGPNVAAVPSTNLGQPGDPQLDVVAAPGVTRDAAVLEFDFIPAGNTITLNFIYGSGDYNNGAGTPPGDPMGIFINNTQRAFVPGTTLNINPTTINGTTNQQFYVENTALGNRNTRMHGFTRVLFGSFTVRQGEVNHLKLAIADNGVATIDSYLLVGTGSLVSGNVDTYRPLRYVYNSFADTFEGNITVINRFLSGNDIQGINFAVLSDLPRSVPTVTVFNPTGFTVSGNPYLALPNNTGILSSQVPSRAPVSLRNPNRIFMSTFFLQYAVDATTSLA